MKHLSMMVLSSYTTQRKTFEGRPHIIAPVVLITEGVHCGSGGCMYYPAEELASFPASWNGVPVPILHPISADGCPISCNAPDVIEQSNIGRLFNVIYDDRKLKGEIWIDEAKARQIAPEVLTALLTGKMLEVSTGLFSDDEEVSGEWNGEHYDSIVRNIRPDHLALLPGQTGACSTMDGCGVRANSKEGGTMIIPHDVYKESIFSFIRNYRTSMSYEDRRRAIQKEVDKRDIRPIAEDDDYAMHYVLSTYSNYFIYAKETKEGMKMYRCNYTIEGDTVTCGEEREVREETKYVDVTDNSVKTNEKEEQRMEKCCKEKVQALIDNADNSYTESDKTWLLELSPEVFERIVANAKPVVKEAEAPKKAETVEEIVANVTEDLKAQVEEGIKLFAEKKASLIATILANKQNKFEKEELESKSIKELEKIATLASMDDFGGRGSADMRTNTTNNSAEILELPSMNFEKK